MRTRTKTSTWLVVAALLGAGAYACGGEGSTDQGEGESDVITATAAAGKKEPVSAETRRDLYHISEGSEIFPYFAVRALRVAVLDDGTVALNGVIPEGKTGKVVPFMDQLNLSRYGLLPDEKTDLPMSDGVVGNHEGLPIGLTLARTEDTGFISLGVNCSVCHVGELRYKTGKGELRTLRVEGAPNMFSIQNFYGELIAGLRTQAPTPEFKARARAEVPYVVGLYPLYGNEGSYLEGADRQALQLNLLLDLAKIAENPPKTSAEVDAKIDALNLGDPTTPAVKRQKRLLFARFMFLAALLGRGGGSPGGPGRTDAFGAAKNSLFAHIGFNRPTNAPVSYPSMFNMETEFWFHYNSNTTSVIERNIGQSLGLGAVADIYESKDEGGKTVTTFDHTANLGNLHTLETSIYKIAPPEFPSDGGRDAKKATRGKTVYLQKCQSCHEATPVDKTGTPVSVANADLYLSPEIALDTMLVDRNQADNFDVEVVGKPLASRLSDVLGALKQNYYTRKNVPAATQAEFDNLSIRPDPVTWRNTPSDVDGNKIIRSKPLDGVWATAPFLHNGSVPTLMDLLKPAAQRPAKFRVGHRLYDTKNVGYLALGEDGTPIDAEAAKAFTAAELAQAKREASFVINASPKDAEGKPSTTGNSNQGHEFGVDLPQSDKEALLEFLKGFGGSRKRPIVFGKKK